MLTVKKKYVLLIFKIAIGILSFWLIYSKLKEQLNQDQFFKLVNQISTSGNGLFFLLVVFLLFVNWGIESKKWQMLVCETQKISFRTAYASVLAGICVGNLTPGRTGEFLGKIFFFKNEVRGKITILHFINGLTQLIITSIGGIIAFMILLSQNEFQSSSGWLLVFSAMVFTFFLFFFYFRVDWVIEKISRLSFLSKLNVSDLKVNPFVLNRMLLLSVFRYGIFCFQYISLLLILGVDVPFNQLVLPVMVSFLLTSAIPMISFIEAAVRSAIALLVFSEITSNNLVLVLAATLIWVINIVIPSVLGYIILVRKKFVFSKNDE